MFVYVPICIATTCLLVERTARLLRLAGLAAISPPIRSATGEPAAVLTSTPRDRRIGFWLGVMIPIAALYPGAWALALLNGIIHPLIPVH